MRKLRITKKKKKKKKKKKFNVEGKIHIFQHMSHFFPYI